jgi:hypothetical protein
VRFAAGQGKCLYERQLKTPATRLLAKLFGLACPACLEPKSPKGGFFGFYFPVLPVESRATRVHGPKQTRNTPNSSGKQQKPPALTGPARSFKHLDMGVLIKFTRLC